MLTLLEGSEPLHSDMVLLAIGVTPDTHLAKEAGLRLGIRGSIAVNERMETSMPDIYAVGDAVEVTHFVTGQKALISRHRHLAGRIYLHLQRDPEVQCPLRIFCNHRGVDRRRKQGHCTRYRLNGSSPAFMSKGRAF